MAKRFSSTSLTSRECKGQIRPVCLQKIYQEPFSSPRCLRHRSQRYEGKAAPSKTAKYDAASCDGPDVAPDAPRQVLTDASETPGGSGGILQLLSKILAKHVAVSSMKQRFPWFRDTPKRTPTSSLT